MDLNQTTSCTLVLDSISSIVVPSKLSFLADLITSITLAQVMGNTASSLRVKEWSLIVLHMSFGG